MQHTISNQKLSVTIDTMGAEIVSAKHNGKEMIWQDQTGDWFRHSPILFPVCGFCQMWVDGVQYPITKHGFARNMPFKLTQICQNKATFTLRYNQDTLAVYPYEFEFLATFAVEESNLIVEWTVRNLGNKPLYFFCGGHEGHYLDDTLANYQLVFEKEEVFDSLNAPQGTLDGNVTHYGKGATLNVPANGLANKMTVILGNLNSRKVTLQHKNGKPVFAEQFDGFGNMLLWSPDGNRCLCVEPWQNLPDGPQTATTNISQKANAQRVEPNGSKTLQRVITYF